MSTPTTPTENRARLLPQTVKLLNRIFGDPEDPMPLVVDFKDAAHTQGKDNHGPCLWRLFSALSDWKDSGTWSYVDNELNLWSYGDNGFEDLTGTLDEWYAFWRVLNWGSFDGSY